MIARVWNGIVPADKAEAYSRYLADSERGVGDYARTPGNRGYTLLRREEGALVHFCLISLWESKEAIAAYAGADIEQARYFPFDLECLVNPDPKVTHYDVLSASRVGTGIAATG